MSHYGSYHVFDPRSGDLARSALQDLNGAIPTAGGSDRYRLVDHDAGVLMTGTRDECLDSVERAWWLVATAAFTAERVAAAEHAARLMFECWDPVRGYVSDACLTNLELDRHGGGQSHV